MITRTTVHLVIKHFIVTGDSWNIISMLREIISIKLI